MNKKSTSAQRRSGRAPGVQKPFDDAGAANIIGVTSLFLGGLLALRPQSSAKRLGLPTEPVSRSRALGLADAGLGAAILAGRRIAPDRRWQTVAARSALHLVFGREYARAGNRSRAALMGLMFAVDTGVALALRRTTSRG